MFCGTRSFSRADDDDGGGSPRPKRSKLKQSLSLEKGKNPYATNGLDKFEKLLAELEAKKKEIKLRKGTDDDTVRFRYADTDDWIPIVIKRPKPPQQHKKMIKEKKSTAPAEAEKPAIESRKKDVVAKKRLLSWNVRCWTSVIALVLMCLVFGRTFAVCGATILWYVVPTIKCKSGRPFAAEQACRGLESTTSVVKSTKNRRRPSRAATFNSSMNVWNGKR